MQDQYTERALFVNPDKVVFPDKNNNESNDSLSSPENNNTRQQINFSEFFSQVFLSTRSRNFLIFRIWIFSLSCIFIPMETVIYTKLEDLESKYIIDKITNFIPLDVVNSNYFYIISKIIISISGSKDNILIYICLMYIAFNPFIALKLSFVIGIVYYIIVILQLLYRSQRPFWHINDNVFNKFCFWSYASPSTYFFLTAFAFMYSIISYKKYNKRQPIFSWVLLNVIYLLVITIQGITWIINKVNYIYQIFLALVLALLFVCLLLDLDTYIHSYLYKAMKTKMKSRVYKMDIFLKILGLVLLGIGILIFVPNDNLNEIEDRLSNNTYCGKYYLKRIGKEETFINIAFIFSVIGSMWGVSLTIEVETVQWWECSSKNRLWKSFVSLIFAYSFWFLTGMIKHEKYEIAFIINSGRYFLANYIGMGVIPVLFDKFGLNTVSKETRDKAPNNIISKKLIGSMSYQSSLYNDSFSEPDNTKECNSKITSKNMNKNSIIVRDVDEIIDEKKLDFISGY